MSSQKILVAYFSCSGTTREAGGSGIANCGKNLRKAYPGIDWCAGKLMNGPLSEKQFAEWLETINRGK